MTKRLDLKFIENHFEENGCKLLTKDYKNNKTPLSYECVCGEINVARFDSFQSGNRCKKCGYKKLQKYPNAKINEQQKELLIGSLLGDGSLSKLYTSNWNSYFFETHCKAQYEYALWKKNFLYPFATFIAEYKTHAVKIENSKLVQDKSRSLEKVVFKTVVHHEFTKLEKKWYLRKNGQYVFDNNGRRIKIVPKDLKLTPFIIAVWYFDDGFHQADKKAAYLCSCGFSKEEVVLLSEKLKSFGINNHMIRKNQIYIEVSSYFDFMKLISPYLPCDSMKYKVTWQN